jgi:disulfide bond formation protein DsbB
MNARAAIHLNAIGPYAVSLVLLLGFFFQLVRHELPCPLCLLQRVAFAALAVGPILNTRRGPRPSHYGMSLLAALVGVMVAVRQVMLHILPGNPGYGSAVFGLHYYTWSALIFVFAMVLIGLVLQFDRQFEPEPEPAPPLPAFARIAVWLIMLVVATDIITTFLECGPTLCAEDPVRYELLQGR